jgi:hypothetical protein
MKTKLILLILLLASGCTFQVEVLNTPTPQSPGSVLEPFKTSTPMPSPAVSATPSVLPTLPASTSLATTQSTSANASSSSSIRQIVFSQNGTAQSVPGGLTAGESQTYSLSAFQGQVMSVSVSPEKSEHQNSFELEIEGRDGVVLCPFQNYGCPFWRGALPSTQEYFITVTAQVDDVYVMNIAINPPGAANQYFEYSDPLGRYTLSFSDEFASAHFPGTQIYKFPPQLVLQYIDTQQYIPTNLSEAYFMVGASNDPQQVATCTEPASIAGLETGVGEVKIAGNTYIRSEIQQAAAGNIYEVVYHRTVQNGVCYEISYFTHYGNIGNYVPGDVKEFDRASLLQKFEDILATLTFK